MCYGCCEGGDFNFVKALLNFIINILIQSKNHINLMMQLTIIIIILFEKFIEEE